jgi:hypothetical protein
MTGPGELLLLFLLLVAAAMSGAFARLLRLPATPVAVLFGVLLAHGPSAALDARSAAALQPAASVALCLAALVTGLRLTTPAATFARRRPAVAGHLLAEIALVPALVWAAMVGIGGVPAQVALVVGLMGMGSLADAIVARARRAGVTIAPSAGSAPGVRDRVADVAPAERSVGGLVDALAAVARADLAASLALSLAAVWALRWHFDPPALEHGIELPFAACCLLLGAGLGLSAPGLMARLLAPARGAFDFSLTLCGMLAGATIVPALLPHALFIASLAVGGRLAGKLLACAWARRDVSRGAGLRGAGLVLAPGGLLGVAIILAVRHEPSLAAFADMFLAVGVWIAVLNSTLGPLLARLALQRLVAAEAADVGDIGGVVEDAAPPGEVSPSAPRDGAARRPPSH